MSESPREWRIVIDDLPRLSIQLVAMRDSLT